MQQALCKYSPGPALEGLVLFEECWVSLKLKWVKAGILDVENSQVHVWFL